MATKITLFITLIAYSFIVSQSFMYLLALKNVQFGLDGRSFTEFRQLIDINMRSTFKYALYTAVIGNFLLLILNYKQPGQFLFIMAAIAFLALIAEILLTVKGNLPINDIINQWTPGSYPANWAEYRQQWFDIFQYRQLINILGFISLLAGVIFRSR
jgi:uncharacterized membrane protein